MACALHDYKRVFCVHQSPSILRCVSLFGVRQTAHRTAVARCRPSRLRAGSVLPARHVWSMSANTAAVRPNRPPWLSPGDKPVAPVNTSPRRHAEKRWLQPSEREERDVSPSKAKRPVMTLAELRATEDERMRRRERRWRNDFVIARVGAAGATRRLHVRVAHLCCARRAPAPSLSRLVSRRPRGRARPGGRLRWPGQRRRRQRSCRW